MLKVLPISWPLLLGVMLLMVGNGMQGSLLGIRGALEGFSTYQLSYVMSAYFVGFLFGSRAGARDDPPGRPCAGLRGAGLADFGGADPVSGGARTGSPGRCCGC